MGKIASVPTQVHPGMYLLDDALKQIGLSGGCTLLNAPAPGKLNRGKVRERDSRAFFSAVRPPEIGRAPPRGSPTF